MAARPVRILLVDDHTLFRQGLARLLEAEPGFEVVGQSASVAQGLQAARDSRPDIVLLDVSFPEQGAAEFLSGLPRDSGCKVLLVTALANAGEIARLLDKGAHGAFLKTTTGDRLAGAIRQVLAGDVWVDQVLLRAFARVAAEAEEAGDLPVATSRESEILVRVRQGLSSKQIAEDFGTSESAVKAGLHRLFRKFGVSNRAQLVAVSGKVREDTP